MPPVNQTVGIDLASMGYVPVAVPGAAGAPPNTNQQVTYPTFQRCPLPPIWTSPPDSLRYYYTNSIVPQTRLFNANNISTQTGGVTNNYVTSSTSSGSSSSTSTATIKAVQASTTTTAVAPNSQFVGTILMSKSFQLLMVTTSAAARVQLYGTLFAQSSDLARSLDAAVPAETTQNIITDVALDTSPFQWSWQDRVGANADTPQTSNIYLTVTNLGVAVVPITVTITYVPLENA
jgi:hypothetical protein